MATDRLENMRENILRGSVYKNEEEHLEVAQADISDCEGPTGLALVSSIIGRWKSVEIKPMEIFQEAKRLDIRDKTVLFRVLVNLGFFERISKNNTIVEMYKEEWNEILKAVGQGFRFANTKGVYIPQNNIGIYEDYYSLGEIIVFLKAFKERPDAVQFLAEMIEDYEVKEE